LILYDLIRFLYDKKKLYFAVVLCYMALSFPSSVCRQNCSRGTTSVLVDRSFGILNNAKRAFCFSYIMARTRYILSGISWREQGIFRWLNDNILFVLDEHAYLNLYSAGTPKTEVCGLICHSIPTHYSDFEPISLCSFSITNYDIILCTFIEINVLASSWGWLGVRTSVVSIQITIKLMFVASALRMHQ
jgi:hypothetical protein